MHVGRPDNLGTITMKISQTRSNAHQLIISIYINVKALL